MISNWHMQKFFAFLISFSHTSRLMKELYLNVETILLIFTYFEIQCFSDLPQIVNKAFNLCLNLILRYQPSKNKHQHFK
jgi:hypothetical protein